MNPFHRAWKVFAYQMGRVNSSPRIPILFLIIGIYIYSTVEPVAYFARSVGIASTPWIFPHLTSDYICQMVFMAGVIFLFCDAPFTDESYSYIVSRSGRTAWSAGHVLYIAAMSLIYVFFIAGASVLPLLNSLQGSWHWGKVLGTLARTNAGRQYGMTFTVSNYLTGAYSPATAALYSFLLEWACAAWFGLLTYFFNAVTHRMVGTFLSAAFVLLDLMISNEWTPRAFAFSPITLSQLSTFKSFKIQFGITLSYAAKFFIISLSVLAALCISRGFLTRFIRSTRRSLFKKKGRSGTVNG